MAKTFALNFQELYELDITPEAVEPTWARLGPGLTTADPGNNEDIDQTKYLDGDGFGSSAVIGMQRTVSFSGHRVVGDAAQDFIASVEYEAGSERETTFRAYDAQGNKVQKECTIANIDFGGGDAGAKQDVSFEIHLNGKPVRTPKSAAAELTSTVATGTTVGTTTFTATPDGTNTLAYQLKAASIGTVYGDQYVSGLIPYTSGDEIEATVGQFLCMYELNEYGRVAKFAEHELAALDIA